MRKYVNFLFAGTMAKHIAGTRPLTTRERWSWLAMGYWLSAQVVHYMWLVSKEKEDQYALEDQNRLLRDELLHKLEDEVLTTSPSLSPIEARARAHELMEEINERINKELGITPPSVPTGINIDKVLAQLQGDFPHLYDGEHEEDPSF